jgi:DNA-binding response OmpR family regulator
VETVLLVEDEDAVRAVLRTVLRRQGYTVLEASHAAQALDASRDYAGRIDLLMTDLIMPHMNGDVLASEVRHARPETRVLFMSGFGEQEFADGLAVRAPFIQKPFTPAIITRKVRDVLDSAGW